MNHIGQRRSRSNPIDLPSLARFPIKPLSQNAFSHPFFIVPAVHSASDFFITTEDALSEDECLCRSDVYFPCSSHDSWLIGLFACSYTIVDYKLEQYFSLTPYQLAVNNPRSFTTNRLHECTQFAAYDYPWAPLTRQLAS